jgi:hypothetical protein
MSSTSSGPASVDEILRGAGLDGLGKDPASEAVRACIERLWSRVSTEDKGQQALVRGEALKRLEDASVRAPATTYDAIVDSLKHADAPAKRSTGTLPAGGRRSRRRRRRDRLRQEGWPILKPQTCSICQDPIEEFWTDEWPLGKLTDEWPLGKITDTYPKAEGFSGGSG